MKIDNRVKSLWCEYCKKYVLHHHTDTTTGAVGLGFFTCGLAWLALPAVLSMPSWYCSVCGTQRKDHDGPELSKPSKGAN